MSLATLVSRRKPPGDGEGRAAGVVAEGGDGVVADGGAAGVADGGAAGVADGGAAAEALLGTVVAAWTGALLGGGAAAEAAGERGPRWAASTVARIPTSGMTMPTSHQAHRGGWCPDEGPAGVIPPPDVPLRDVCDIRPPASVPYARAPTRAYRCGAQLCRRAINDG
jgi:hypothetical protein